MANLWWRLVRFGFYLLYNQLAFTYDLVSFIASLGAWRCWQRTALRYLPPPADGLILELAHGTGNLQVDLIQAGYKAMGCDLSPYMGRIAREKLRKAGLPVRLARANASHLPYPSETYAAVISTFPTAFITLPAVLEEIYRVLQPGGLLIIVPGAAFTGGSVFSRLLEWLYRITGQREDHSFSFTDWLDEAGFESRIALENCPYSQVTLILGRKKGAGIPPAPML